MVISMKKQNSNIHLNEAQTALSKAQFKESQKSLEKIKDSYEHQLMNERDFLSSKNHLLQGDYDQSLSVIDQNMEKFKAPSYLLCEKANLFLLKSDFSSWRKTWKQSEEQFEKDKFLLKPSLQFRIKINFNKFLEIDGAIHEALNSYKELLKKAESLEESLLCKSQILRLDSVFGNLASIKDNYFSLLEHNQNSNDNSLFFEIQHALFLSELRFYGMDLAKERLIGILENKKVSQPDKNLFIMEAIEHSLLQRNTSLGISFDRFLSEDLLGTYDKTLIQLYKNPEFSLEVSDCMNLKQELSYSELLKVTMISLLRAQNELMENYFKVNLSRLSKKSQQIWEIKLNKKSLSQSKTVISLDKKQGKIIFKNKEILVKNIAFLEKLFEVFSVKNEIETSEVIGSVFDCDLNFKQLEKLRVYVSRVEKKFYELTLESKVFSISKKKVSKKENVELRVLR